MRIIKVSFSDGKSIKYLLLTYSGEDLAGAKRFSSEHEGLELDPYGDLVPFEVASNQRIIREDQATQKEISVADYDLENRGSDQMHEAYRLGRRDARAGVADINSFTVAWGEKMGEAYAEGVAEIAMLQQTLKDDDDPDSLVNQRTSGNASGKSLHSGKKIAFDCGGYSKVKKDKTHSGKLDTQTFPECAGHETDRDIVSKHRKRQKSHKKTSV